MTDRIIRPNAGFIIPTRRFVDVGMPRSGVSAKGRYQLRVLDAWGIEKRRTPWFDNIILDSGLNRWGTGTIIAGAGISTGTSTPAATDTDLQASPYHYTTTAGTGSGIAAGIAPNYNNTRTFVYRTALGALNGNYAEVGVGWASGSMFSRALILDGLGNPTTISVSSTEQLDIVYQLSVYPPLVDTGPDVVTIAGVDYDVTGRALAVSSLSGFTAGWAVMSTGAISIVGRNASLFDGSLAAITATQPSGSSAAGFSDPVTSSYASNSMAREGFIPYGLTQGNAAGGVDVSTVSWGTGDVTWFASFQYGFSPVIPKDGTKTLALNYSINWGRRP